MTDFSPLNPDPEELGRAWKAKVEAEYEQVERLREWQDQAGDHYQPIAHHFADDPHRTDDPHLNLLREWSRSDATWLDIGAGGGRYALPLALVSEKVIAVEPSGGMRDVLRSGMAQHGIENIDLLDLRWPEGADTVTADFSLVAHVGYDIREINPFIDGLERATRELCCVMLMDRAPSSGFLRLWQQVHGEPRQQLPGMREFLHLLLARGATPEVRTTARKFRTMDEEGVRDEARRRLWLSEGSQKDQRTQSLLNDILASGDTDFQLPSVVALITWEPVRGDG
jgi:SAM-dependent methyltransferase